MREPAFSGRGLANMCLIASQKFRGSQLFYNIDEIFISSHARIRPEAPVHGGTLRRLDPFQHLFLERHWLPPGAGSAVAPVNLIRFGRHSPSSFMSWYGCTQKPKFYGQFDSFKHKSPVRVISPASTTLCINSQFCCHRIIFHSTTNNVSTSI